MKVLQRLVLLALFTLVICHRAFALPQEEMLQYAKTLWDKYYLLEQTFDSAAADLYTNTALIKSTRRYPNGTSREMIMDVRQYKNLIRSTVWFAKVRGDTNQYSNFIYTIENDRVRIKVTRFNNIKKYESPLELLVGPDSSGQWVIFEEISLTQPF